MSTFSEKPILLVNDKFELNQEGVDFIKSLSDKKISIISIIGPKSSGKSFLSNQLVGIFTNGFEIASINQNECCTKGVWVWGKPIINNDTYTLILDSQGFQAENEEQIKFNQKIFILLNLISSTVIYNYKRDDGSEDNNNIGEQVLKNSFELFLKLLPILDNVKLDKNDNKISVENIPNYFWVYRDYSISDFNKYNDTINSLTQGNAFYNSLFKNKINYFSLPPPMEENDMLINLYLDEDDDGKGGPFDEEYKKKIEEFKKNVFGSSPQKNLSGTLVVGSLLEQLISDYTKSLSLNETIYVNGILSNLIGEEVEKIKNDIIEKLKNNLIEKNGSISDFINKVKNSYEILSDKTFSSFGEAKIPNNCIVENIDVIIDLFGKELIDKYLNNNLSEYNEAINNLISQKENSSSLLSNKISQKEDIKIFFNNFNEEVKKDLENNIFNTKYEFLNCFPLLKNYLEKCIFNQMNSYIDNINEFFDTSLKEQKASEETMKLLEEKNNEINNQKNEIEKLTTNINELKNNLESKEKEYETNLQAKKEENEKKEKEYETNIQTLKEENDKKEKEYENNLQAKKEENEKLEQEKKLLAEEKDNIIKELQEKINNLESEKKDVLEKNDNLQKNLDDMTNKNKELEQKVNEFIEKEKRKPKPQMVNVKEEDLPKLVELFNEIQSTTKEYSELIKTFTQNKSKILFYNQFIEESKSSIENSCAGWVEELKKISKEKSESKDNVYNQEIAQLKEDKNKLNEELNKIKDEVNEAKDENKKLADELKLAKEIRNDIETYKKDNEAALNLLKSTNEMQEKRLNENKKKISEMEISLSEFKIDSKIKEEELYSTLNAFRSLLEKNKKNFELNLKKLSENVKNEIINLNKKYKIMK